MDATCTIQDSIHVFSLVHKYVSRILGTYHYDLDGVEFLFCLFIIAFADLMQISRGRLRDPLSC